MSKQNNLFQCLHLRNLLQCRKFTQSYTFNDMHGKKECGIELKETSSSSSDSDHESEEEEGEFLYYTYIILVFCIKY